MTHHNRPIPTHPTTSPLGRAGVAAFCAELVGTFMFVFSGTATVLAVHTLSPHSGFTVTDDIAISLAFALGIVAAVYTVAPISGAHINPAVTVALATVRRFPWRQVPAYVLAQLAGGLLAALANWYLFGDRLRRTLLLGTTKPGPHSSTGQALLIEVIVALLLILVVMATAVTERAPGGPGTAGLSIGLWVGAAIFLALPVSGGSLNPARTLGPDIVSVRFPSWWIYVVGPLAGAILGAVLWQYVLGKGDKNAVQRIGRPHAQSRPTGEGNETDE